MPGLIIHATCVSCDAEHELRVGHGLGWAFEQHACHACRRLVSVAVAEELVSGPCGACGTQLEPWPVRAETEVIRARCPACLELTRWRVVDSDRWE